MKAIYIKIFTITLSVLLGLHVHAVVADVYSGPVLQVGWFVAKQGKAQHINIEGLIGDDFGLDHSTSQNILVGAGYYFNGLETNCIALSYGLNAFYLAPTKVSGDVTLEDAYSDLSYRYFLTNYPIYLAAKAFFHCTTQCDITLDLGVGPNIIRASSFKEKSLDDGITIPDTPHAPLFSGKTNATFSACGGIGVRLNNIFKNISLEIDYRFFYLGQGRLKRNNDQLINTLHTGNMYANAFFLSVSI